MMTKKIGIGLLLVLATIAGIALLKKLRGKTTARYTIGILQTASHPALDACRQGFTKTLTEKLNGDVHFIVQNAQGSIPQAHAIAEQFYANKQLNGFFTIATPATQALASLEKERPIFIAAVTDPHSLGLISPTTNVCGTSDMINVPELIDLLTTLTPSTKKVGILYTAGETNSLVAAQKIHNELTHRHITALDFTINNESDVQATVESACKKVDALVTPTDNTVASTISLIASITCNHKIPLIVSFEAAAQAGALAAQGVDYTVSGNQTAEIAYQVLVEGKKPYDLSIEHVKGEQLFINKETLNALNLSLPESLQNRALLIS